MMRSRSEAWKKSGDCLAEVGVGTRVPAQPNADDPLKAGLAECKRIELEAAMKRDPSAPVRPSLEDLQSSKTWTGMKSGFEVGPTEGSDEGQSVEVTFGERLFQPVQFNHFIVGPFKASTMVRKGETVAGAILRLHAEMLAAAEQVQERASEAYLRALREVGEKARR